MILTFAPIRVWPEGWRERSDYDRETSRFDATYSATLILLDRELEALNSISAQLQVDATSGQLRADGQLRSDARVDHPGVILTIETKKLGTLIYSTDRFIRPTWKSKSPASWQHNLRAIALGLEALRKIERYGIAERGQQYAGYRELGSGIPLGSQPAPSMTADEAATFMAVLAGWPSSDIEHVSEKMLNDSDLADLAYKLAAKTCHPDVGGDADTFKKLGEARRIVASAWRR